MCDFSIVSNALNMASCSAWLLEHLLWSVYFNWCSNLLWTNIHICVIFVLKIIPCTTALRSHIVTNFTFTGDSFVLHQSHDRL